MHKRAIYTYLPFFSFLSYAIGTALTLVSYFVWVTREPDLRPKLPPGEILPCISNGRGARRALRATG